MKYYQFLYYNLIKIWKKKKDEIENAPINGIITITFFPFLNLASIPLIIMAILGTSALNIPTFNKWNVLYFFAVFGFVNYWTLLRKGKSKQIIERFNKLDFKVQKKGYQLTITYMVVSLAIPLIILFFLPSRP
jgi:hypothetical protein